MSNWRFLGLLLLCLGSSDVASAQQLQQYFFTPPEKGECATDKPRYPPRQLDEWTEGWVELRFGVKADGTTEDIVIQRQLGRGGFGEHILNWIRTCTFKPATRNGTPVAGRAQLRIFYSIKDMPTGAARPMLRRFEAIDTLLQRQDWQGALAMVEAADKEAKYLYEFLHILIRRGQAMAIAGDLHLGLRTFQSLDWAADTSLPERERKAVQRQSLKMALAQDFYLDAKDIAANVDGFGDQPGDDQLKQDLAALEAMTGRAEPIVVRGQIPTLCNPEICVTGIPAWAYRPVRRTISLVDVVGELATITADCDARTFTAKAEPNLSWRIPASWGTCTVTVTGKAGTSFRLVDDNPSPQ